MAEFEHACLPVTADGTTVFQCIELEDYSTLDPQIVPTLERAVRVGAESEQALPTAAEPRRT